MTRQGIHELLRDYGHLVNRTKRPAKPEPHTGPCEWSVVPEGHPAHHIAQWDSQYCQKCGGFDWSGLGF